MKGARAAKRYAGALLGLASEMKKADVVAADMRLIHGWVKSTYDLKLFFESPIIDRIKKRGAIEAIFKGRIDELTERFLFLLVDKTREALIDSIAVEFGVLYDQSLGIANADLISAYELDEPDKSKLQHKLEQLSNKRIRISSSIDRTLVGGFVARVGDTVYDGSVRRQLEILKQQLRGKS